MSVKLNKEQEDLINTINGQVICVACPGSGKTTTSLRRINNMIDQGVSPKNILMITFTKASAMEMSSRYNRMYGKSDVKFGTIHSVCFELLRIFEGKYTLESILSNPSSLIYEILKDDKRYKDMNERYASSLLLDISNIKNNLISIDSDFNSNCDISDVWYMYKKYEEYKHFRGLIDFDDILILTYNMILNNNDILKNIQNRYRYIIVDEAQDLNYIQRDIIYKIAGVDGNLCIVGDDDQSIYGFRGAKPEIMMNFVNDYPNAKSIYMTTNYRSNKKVIEHSKNIIMNNDKRFNKEFKTSRRNNGTVECVECTSRYEEMYNIIDLMKELNDKQNAAILYRTNSEGGFVADMLMENKIDFYSREPVYNKYTDSMFKDIKAFINMANGHINQNDYMLTTSHPNRWIKNIDIRKTGLDKTKMYEYIKIKNNLPKSKFINKSNLENINNYLYLIDRLSKKKHPLDILDFIFKDFEYSKYLKECCKIRNMDYNDLVNVYDNYRNDIVKNNIKSVAEWSAFIKKYTIKLNNIKNNPNEKITISTLHGSKGLEWSNVYIINCNHSINPFIRSDYDDEQKMNVIQEERRLFYVGCTRAKDNLKLFYYNDGSKDISEFVLESKCGIKSLYD